MIIDIFFWITLVAGDYFDTLWINRYAAYHYVS